MFQPVLSIHGLIILMPAQITGNSIRKSMKLKYIKPGLCKITFFFNVCHINLNVKVRKRNKREIKSIMSFEDEERHFYHMTLSKSSENILRHTDWSS